MDESTVKWSKKRYDEIQKGILPFLLKTGFKEEDIKWIPISGLTGDNITEKSDS
jgi:peptide chain release factor subunit 3